MQFSRKQLRALTWWMPQSPDFARDAIVLSGSVRSGKTLCLGLSFFLWAGACFSGQSFALCGKTVRSLQRNLITTLLPALRAAGLSCAVKSGELRVRCGKRENRFYLFGGKDEGSAALIQGLTLAGVLFDEVALMPRSFVEQALARCSVAGSRFWFNCNPEGPDHWFYREWVCRTRQRRALYLHFTMADNPGLSPAMRARYERLYTGTFYERFVEGRWVAAQGLIYPFMEADKMACDPPAGPFSDYVVSCDYGTRNPSSFGLWACQGETWYRIDEYYYDGRKNGARTDEEHYQGLRALCAGRSISCVVVDPSAASFLEVIHRHGEYRAIPAVNEVLTGIRKTGMALKEGRVRICRNCRDIWREFAHYRWMDGKEAPRKEDDHAMDDLRYFVTTVLDRRDRFCALSVARASG